MKLHQTKCAAAAAYAFVEQLLFTSSDAFSKLACQGRVEKVHLSEVVVHTVKCKKQLGAHVGFARPWTVMNLGFKLCLDHRIDL